VDPDGAGLTKEDIEVLELEDRHQYFLYPNGKRQRRLVEAGEDLELEWENTLVVSFRCCSEFLYKTWPGWLLSMRRQGGTRGGEASLVDELHASILERAGKWSETDEGLAVEEAERPCRVVVKL
jgi:hypothetical protein